MVVPPEDLRRQQGWVAIDGKVYNIEGLAHSPESALKDSHPDAAALLEEWGGRVCPDPGLWKKAVADAELDKVLVGELAPKWTLEQVADAGYVAFQGGVFDLSEFATRHPGGSELITDWNGKDGTGALLDAHPGGQAMIRSTLSAAEFSLAYKGSIPYTRKKRSVVRRKRRKQRLTSEFSAVLQFALVYIAPALLAIFLAWKLEFRLEDWVPANWPTRDHIVHLLFGAIFAVGAQNLLRRIGLLRSNSTNTNVTLGTGVGGWSYGAITPMLVARIREACPAKGQVGFF